MGDRSRKAKHASPGGCGYLLEDFVLLALALASSGAFGRVYTKRGGVRSMSCYEEETEPTRFLPTCCSAKICFWTGLPSTSMGRLAEPRGGSSEVRARLILRKTALSADRSSSGLGNRRRTRPGREELGGWVAGGAIWRRRRRRSSASKSWNGL